VYSWGNEHPNRIESLFDILGISFVNEDSSKPLPDFWDFRC